MSLTSTQQIRPMAELRQVWHSLISTTAGRMRLLGGLGAVLLLVACVAGAIGAGSGQRAIDRGGVNLAQVARAQSMYADLLKADAQATDGFLRAGVETADQRNQYEQAMQHVEQTLAYASAAQPADRAAFGALNTTIAQYERLVERGRAENRQGLPVGASYQQQASSLLRTTALPILQQVIDANTHRTDQELNSTPLIAELVVIWLACLVGLVLGARWLANRTHRRLNLGYLWGCLAVLVGVLALLAGLLILHGALANYRSSEIAQQIAVSRMQSAAYDARSSESLGLIAHGSGQPFEAQWKRDDEAVRSAIVDARNAGLSGTEALQNAWSGYVTVHQRVRAQDDGGDWDTAVVTSGSAAGKAFATFVTESDRSGATTAQAPSGLQDMGRPFWIAIVGLPILGLGGSWLLLRGIAKRLEDYR